MRIRIPIHPAFWEADDEVLLPDSYEKATKKATKKLFYHDHYMMDTVIISFKLVLCEFIIDEM